MDRIRWMNFYQDLKSPGFSKRMNNELLFHRTFLEGANLVFDIGGNVGNKTKIYSEFVSKVVVVEPEYENLSILEGRFKSNKRVEIVPCAISDQEGEQEFYIHEEGSGVNTLSKKWKNILETPNKNRWNTEYKFEDSYLVKVITLDKLIQKYGKPVYIKIDVEGWEKQVIQGLTNPIQLISFECNFPEFKKESLDCLDHLWSLSKEYTFNYVVNNKFEFDKFLSYEEFVKFLKSDSTIRYMEIYCKNSVG